MMPTMRMRVQLEGKDAVAVKIKDEGSRSRSSEKFSCYRILLDGPAGKHGRGFMCCTFLIFVGALACWTLLSAGVGVGSFGLRMLPDARDPELMKIRDMARIDREQVNEIVLSPREVKIKEIEDARSEEVKLLLTRINEEVQGVLTPNKRLGPRITDWDAQREVARKIRTLQASGDSSNPRILLMTSSQPQSCENHQMQLKSIKNKLDYCRLHGLEIFYNMVKLDEEMVGSWAKVFLTHMVMLDHPDVDWILWMDTDAVFTDMNFELPMNKYKNYSMVMHGRDENVYDKRSSVGLNTGMFLIRNCQWSLDLLHAWAPLGSKGPARSQVGKLLNQALPDHTNDKVDDQTALVWLLISQRSKWVSKVYLEDSNYLQADWRLLTTKFEEIMEKNKPGVHGDHRWPFVVHFTGCQFCMGRHDRNITRDNGNITRDDDGNITRDDDGNITRDDDGSITRDDDGNITRDECMTQLKRAVNFADNQVIDRYGFRHTSLHSHELEPRRNITTNATCE